MNQVERVNKLKGLHLLAANVGFTLFKSTDLSFTVDNGLPIEMVSFKGYRACVSIPLEKVDNCSLHHSPGISLCIQIDEQLQNHLPLQKSTQVRFATSLH